MRLRTPPGSSSCDSPLLGRGRRTLAAASTVGELGSIEVDQEALTEAVDAFGTSRLLSFDRDPRTGAGTVEVAHEALLREWARLRRWIDAAREDVRMHRHLAAAASEWEESGRDGSFLVRGGHLGQFESWSRESGLALTELERLYLATSIEEREAAEVAEEARRARETVLERRSLNRLRALVAVFAAAALVAAGLMIFAFRESGHSKRAAKIATGRELTAASVANLDVDPERSILLALRAIETFRSASDTVPGEPVEALHRAVESSRELVTFAGPATGSGVWSPDEKLVATGGRAGAGVPGAALWDARTGKKLRDFPVNRVYSVEFSPDGSRFYTEVRGAGTIAWDVRSGRKLFTLSDPAPVVDMKVSPDGTRLATASLDASLKIWNLRTRRQSKLYGSSALCGLSFSPDGHEVAAAGCFGAGGTVTAWDVRTGEEVFGVAGSSFGSMLGVAFSPDGRRLAIVGTDGKGRVWDRSRQLLATLVGHTGSVTAVAFSPDGARIATGAADGTARIWDAATGRQLLVLKGHTGRVLAVLFSHDGKRLLTGGQDGTDRIWDVSPGGPSDAVTLVAHEGAPGGAESVAFSPDGERLATGGEGGAKLWDARTGRQVWAVRGPLGLPLTVHEVAFSPDGKRILLAADNTSSETSPLNGAVVAAASGSTLLRLAWNGFQGPLPPHTGGAWSSNGEVIALGGIGQATTWDARTGELLRVFQHSTDLTGLGQVARVAFNPGGSRLFTAAWDGTVKVWNVASGQLVETVDAHNDQVNGVAVSPDGTRLVTGSSDGTAKMWALPSGRKLLTLTGHAGAVWDVAFSPDGREVATAGEDTTTRLWDAATGHELLKLTGPTFALRRVAFSPDGRRLATASADGKVRVYILPLGELMAVARSRLTRGWTEAECRRFLATDRCPKAP